MDGEDPNLTDGSTSDSSSSSSTDSSTTAYNQNSSMNQYIALLNQFNQPISMPAKAQQPAPQLATTTSVPQVIKQFFTNLPTKRASGVIA